MRLSPDPNSLTSLTTANPTDSPDNRPLHSTPETCLATACVPCRTRHLKCDRRLPCSRCTDSGSRCTFVASRRGVNRSRPAVTKPTHDHPGGAVPPDQSPPSQNEVVSTPPSSSLSSSSSSSSSSAAAAAAAAQQQQPPPGDRSFLNGQTANPFPASLPWYHHDQSSAFSPDQLSLFLDQAPLTPSPSCFTPKPSPSFPSSPSLADRCLASFYRNFHPAHPFVLPEQFLLALAPPSGLHVLLPAMRWVGSLYMGVGSSTRAALFDEAHRRLRSSSRSSNGTAGVHDGFLVQAMMVLLVGLDGLCELDKARRLLREVEQLAVEVGLNSRAFAALHGQGMPVLEESWRRTWWDLYVVDGMIAGLHRASSFALNDVQADVALPCEEWQYLSGAIPPPRRFDDLDTSVFADDTHDANSLSSFAYRIQSARTLGQLLRLPAHMAPDDQRLSKVEASLTNWRLHLPRCKRDAVAGDGSADEVMFQAHMVHHATAILLHHPHSRLGSLHAARAVNSCAPDRPLVTAVAAAHDAALFNAHTRHVVAAAGEISRLITHRASLRSRTPFFTCVVVLASVVHLNQWAAVFSSPSPSPSASRCFSPESSGHGYDSGDESFLREKVRLSIGALAGMAEVWRTAAVALGQVRGVAREIYEAKRRRQETEAEAAAVDAWSGVVEESFAADVAMACAMMDP